jgi:hypothetical protein
MKRLSAKLRVKTASILTFTIMLCGLGSQGAHAASATLTSPNETQHCSMISPDENGKPAPLLGISKGDLRRLASTSEMNYRWVQWYIGSQRQMEDALKSVPPENLHARVPKVAKCEAIEKFKKIINSDLYQLPKLECIGGNFNYRFRVIGSTIDMELVEVVAPPAGADASVAYARPVTREPVNFSAGTTSGSCQLRINQKRQNARALKICLPTAELSGEGAGIVSMNQGGQPIGGGMRELACNAEPGFAEAARPVIQHEQPALQPTAPATATAARSNQ